MDDNRYIENARGQKQLNDMLFEELERLASLDAGNIDAVNVEVSRAKAIQGIAAQITQSSRIVLETVALRAQIGSPRAPFVRGRELPDG